MRGHCIDCAFAKEITCGPCPSGEQDGVNCQSKRVAEEQDLLEEFEEHGYINLFRIEVSAPDAKCEHWQPKDLDIVYLPSPVEAPVLSCPKCGDEWYMDRTDPEEVLDTLDERENRDESGEVESLDSFVKCKKCEGVFILRGVV